MTHLHIDFETRSPLDIKTVGLDRYARSAEVLMMAWAIDDEEPSLWLPTESEMPQRLLNHISREGVKMIAWNAAFERAILNYCLGMYTYADEWLDPSVMARYATLPAHLFDCSQYLGLGDLAKHDGSRLISKFCKPKKNGKFVQPEEAPEDWETFKRYCLQDVIAEREIFHRLEAAFSLTPFEQRVAQLDAEINERGIPVDMQFVAEAKKLVDAEKKFLKAEMQELTGLKNPNSRTQLLPWLKSRGYPHASLLKKRVATALAGDLSGEARRVLGLRARSSRSSLAKLDALIARTGPDGRLRYGYKFLGADRTGRWSGNGVQPHNMPR